MDKNKETVEDVLNAYVASVEAPSHTVLLEWIKRYPEYEKELTDFSVSWSLMTSLAPHEAAEEPSEDALVNRAMDIAWSRLRSRGETSIVQSPLSSLLAEGRKRSLSIANMADFCQLSLAIIRKLDLRQIDYRSIPRSLVAKIAQSIGRTQKEVSEYLQLPMKLPAGADYRSQAAPQLPEAPEDFFDAVRKDPALRQDWKSLWLTSAPMNPQE